MQNKQADLLYTLTTSALVKEALGPRLKGLGAIYKGVRSSMGFKNPFGWDPSHPAVRKGAGDVVRSKFIKAIAPSTSA